MKESSRWTERETEATKREECIEEEIGRPFVFWQAWQLSLCAAMTRLDPGWKQPPGHRVHVQARCLSVIDRS